MVDHLEVALAGIGIIAFLLGTVVILTMNISRRKKAEAALLASDQQRKIFYRETILSVTDGKLNIVDDDDVRQYLDNSRIELDIDSAARMGEARDVVRRFCIENGLSPKDTDSYILGVGEAMTNAIKHGVEGHVRAGIGEHEVWVGVCDNGPGIESLILPRAVLLQGFSTKPSLGMGYSVMLDVSDRVLLSTGSTGTAVILIKQIGPPQPPPSIDRMLDSLEGPPSDTQ